MKKIILLILLFLMSCDPASEDKEPYVAVPIPDMTVEENAPDELVSLALVFTDDDNEDSEIILRLNDNTNPSLVLVTVDSVRKEMTLDFQLDQIGSSLIKIEATSNEKTVIDAFLVTVTEKPDVAPRVANIIPDVEVFEGAENTTIDLTNVFVDDDGDPISYSVSNEKPGLLTASISSKSLTLAYIADQVDEATITVTATANGKSTSTMFEVEVKQNETLSLVLDAEEAYGSGDYAAAETFFTNAITDGDERYVEKAYVGLGFSQLAQGTVKHDQAYESFNDGDNLDASEYTDDFRAGLAFLEYSLKQNFSSAISLAIQVLDGDAAWEMAFNENINHLDVRLTLAQAYYDSQNFTESLAQVKILDSNFDLTEASEDFLNLLATKLRALADSYRD